MATLLFRSPLALRKLPELQNPQAGEFAKAGVEAGRGQWEFRSEGSDETFEVGGSLTVERFQEGQKVDVTGTSKGKGFQGGVKRWNFSMQDATHGNSISHRSNGSIGQNQTPGRVFKGKKMSGQMGNAQGNNSEFRNCSCGRRTQPVVDQGCCSWCARWQYYRPSSS